VSADQPRRGIARKSVRRTGSGPGVERERTAERVRVERPLPPPRRSADDLAEVDDRPERSPIGRPGWTVIAGKELADHLNSARFLVLLVVLALVAVIPLYFASGRIRDLAEQASGAQAVFLALFTLGSQQVAQLRVDYFVGIVAPLLGVAFAFDAVNGERSEGTLPRLLSQPIHRDDVINGKFAAGLAVIALVLTAVVLLISGFGLLRLGIVPAASEIVRIVAWLAVTILYVGLWLAFGLLLSVLLRRAATSGLIAFGVWILVTIFGALIVGLVAGVIAPIPTTGGAQEVLASAQLQQLITRLLPSTLYREASIVLLDPSVTQVSTPATIGQAISAQQQIPTLLSLDQSLLLVWPHVVALVALTVVCFAAAYVAFMRQEVRA
jgi:ABC-2 type transport system permease protein